MPKPDVFLGVGSGTHGEQTAKALIGVEKVILSALPDIVVVAGDVNSTLAASLAAVKLHVPVAHIEAGLRSFDAAMPEEHNRRLTDAVSTLLLTHSPEAIENLGREGIDPDRVHLVGNTMIDSVLEYLPRALASEPWLAFGVDEREYALVTLHRPSLVDDGAVLARTMACLRRLSEDVPIVFPVHPRTRGRIETLGVAGAASERLALIEPLGYLPFLGLQARARFVITDSGGVQEETSALGTPCFTLRDSTERPITLTEGTNILIGSQPERILDIDTRAISRPHTPPLIPLWDGEAGRRAATAILDLLNR